MSDHSNDLAIDRPRYGPTAPGKVLVAFYRQLATMYEAGIDVRSALRALEPTIRDPALRAGVLAVQSTLQRGGSLAEGMGRFPNVFRPLHVALVAAAETTGRVADALQAIADYEEARLALVRRFVLALVYPFLLLNVAVVLPAIPDLFVGGAGSFARGVVPAFAVLYGLLGLGAAARMALSRSPAAQLALASALWHLPFVGGLVRRQAISRLLRILAASQASGLPILGGLRLASRSSGSPVLERSLRGAAEGVERGEPLTESLAASGLFPATVLALLATGEMTGRLDEMLRRSSETIEAEVRSRVNLLAILVPFLAYLLVALLVAWRIISFWLQYYENPT